MAYMRGDYYIWTDESGIHFWSADGYDNWDTNGWATDENENRLPNRVDASGTSVPTEVVDEFVVMRLAHLLEEGIFTETIARATARDYVRGGNFGHAPLLRQAKAIARALKPLDGRMPAPGELRRPVAEGIDAPHALADSAERQRRLGLLKTPSARPLFDLVEEIRRERGLEREVPYFDPCDGGVEARVLFLLEAPGPKAVRPAS